MVKKLFPKLLPILAIVAGFIWMAGAVEYGLWVRRGPGGGFLPMFAGIATILFAIWVLYGERNEQVSSETVSWRAFLPIAALVGVVFCSYVIGLVLSIALFVILWLKAVEHHKISFSVITGALCAGIIYAIFGMWLQVPFTLGLFEYLL